MPQTIPKHRPGAKLKHEDLPSPASAPSRPADASGHCAGFHWRLWTIYRGRLGGGPRLEHHVFVWDDDGDLIRSARKRSGPQFPHKSRSTRPYHVLDGAEQVDALCHYLRRKREIPTSCGERRLQKEGDTPARLDIASRVAHDRLRAERREPESHATPLVTERTEDGVHTALAHEM
jgi:hypothetical protein